MTTTSMEVQRVVVIQDASSEVSSIAIRWVLQGLSLKPGDMVTLLSVLPLVNNPMGYKSRVDSSMLGVNRRIVEDLAARKKKEYQNSIELIQISKLYEMQKIEFKIIVDAGASPKEVALEAAKKLKATWVILDRKMKKDKKYFLEKLSCGISRMKRGNNVAKLRGPKIAKINKSLSERIFSYEEMLPGPAEGDELFSIELFPPRRSSSMGSTKSARSSSSEDTSVLFRNPNGYWKLATKAIGNYHDQELTCSSIREDFVRPSKSNETYDNSICKNRRPMIGPLETNFSYAELLAATDRFSSNHLISEGAYGTVFKGKLLNGVTITIKAQKDASFEGEKKFKSEIQALGKTRHRNVVMLLGSCLEESRRMLVYEYVCHGSLDRHIADWSCSTLTWAGRMKIALGTSRGLQYLHKNNIIHRDIRPKNIFLRHDHEPLLGGFGHARTQDESDTSSDHQVIGTFGYLAPEYAESGKPTTKADVYALGVVLLELITGWSTTDKRLEDKSLLGWARPLLKGRKYSELIDPRIVTPSDAYQFILIAQLTEKCLCKDPQKRLSMDEVVLKLEHITEENSCSRIDGENLGSVSSITKAQEFREIEETIKHVSIVTEDELHNVVSQPNGNDSLTSTATAPSRRSNVTFLDIKYIMRKC